MHSIPEHPDDVVSLLCRIIPSRKYPRVSITAPGNNLERIFDPMDIDSDSPNARMSCVHNELTYMINGHPDKALLSTWYKHIIIVNPYQVSRHSHLQDLIHMLSPLKHQELDVP